MSPPIRIIQITDTHLFADPQRRLLGLNTHQSFLAVLEAIPAHYPAFDLVLLTGDLSQDDSLRSYQTLTQHMTQLKAPIYAIPGNHDEPGAFRQGGPLDDAGIRLDKSIGIGHWRILLLNSHKPKAAEGWLAKEELAFLDTQLQKYPQQHTLIGLHHHPISAGSPWLDKSILQNRADFLAIVDRHPQIRGVITGHIHQELAGFHKQIPVWATPSTCIQFKPGTHDFALDILPPGYRYLELQANGVVHTHVHRATAFTAFTDADPASKSY